jgi:hypothetical protein
VSMTKRTEDELNEKIQREHGGSNDVVERVLWRKDLTTSNRDATRRARRRHVPRWAECAVSEASVGPLAIRYIPCVLLTSAPG